MSKTLKALKDILKVVASKLIQVFIEVLDGDTGVTIDNSYKYVNEVVQNMENISKIITDNKTLLTDQEILVKIIEMYGYNELTIDFVKDLINESNGIYKNSFKSAKLDMAYTIIKNRLDAEKVNFTEKAIMYAIQFAVNRWFK